MEQVEVIVVGAGVVGLAIAAAIARTGREVLILEGESEYGQGVSSRNSEVIHAGIYYAAGSLKARLCVEGKHLLYPYCKNNGVAYEQTGKLIVATTQEEETQLEGIKQKAAANGVTDLVYWGQSELADKEPRVRATKALFSPSTGIVSSHELMMALLAEVERFGGQLVTSARVSRVSHTKNLFTVNCDLGSEDYPIACQTFINAAGLGAQQVALNCDFVPAKSVPYLHLCRGIYYSYSGSGIFHHLIYPVPEQNSAGLGIHATLDLGGQVKFGPDATYVSGETYSVPELPEEAYVSAIKRYFPGLEMKKLQPAYAGIRPKLQGQGEPFRDFDIQTPETTGIRGFFQLFGIESPGLTASLAIAKHVAAHLAT